MSLMLSEESATCPNCKKPSKFGAYRFIDVGQEPQMKDMILDDSLFGWKCQSCDYVCRVYYDTTVYNPDQNYLIVLDSEEREREIPLSPQHADLKNRARMRLVKSGIELKEKIRIFDAGLDDRALEAYKVFLIGHSEVLEDETAPDSFLFDSVTDGQFQLFAYADSKRLGLFSVPMTVYNSMLEDLNKNFGPENDETIQVIDMRWALKAFQEMA